MMTILGKLSSYHIPSRHAGCRIHGSWAPRFKSIRFQCFCGKKNYSSYCIDYYKTKQRLPKKLKNTTSPPAERVSKSQPPTTFPLEDDHLEEDNNKHSPNEEPNTTCKFAFLVYWDDDLKRWFIPQKQSGCKCHNGHPHIEHPMLRIQPRHAIPINDIGSSLTSALIHNRTGVQLDWNQVDYIRRKEKYAALSSDAHSSSADKLIHQLSQHGISYVTLTADYNSGLLTIRKKKRASNSSKSETTDFNEDLGDDTETPLTLAETLKPSIRTNLTLTSTNQILLIATWTTDDNRRKFDMFPEFLSGDDTEGVNVEERPLNTWCGKDSNNQVFPVLHTFLPSTAQWAKTFVCRSAKLLLPGNGLSRVIKFNTDANKEETRAIGNSLARGKMKKMYSAVSRKDEVVLPTYTKLKNAFSSVLSMMTFPDETKVFENAMQAWCAFHKINRNFTHDSKYKSVLDGERSKNILNRIEIDIVVRWLWYFIKNYKTMEEVELSAFLMEYYMTEVDQTDHIAILKEDTRRKIMEFLCKSFFVHSEMLFESNFDGMTMEEVTTSIIEAWHRATKRVEGGPRPNHDLGFSMEKIKTRTDKNTTSKAKRAAFDATAKPSKQEDRLKFDTGLTDFCNRHLFNSFKRSTKNEIFRVNENTWWVKRNHALYPTTVEDDLGKAHAHCQSLLDTMNKNLNESTDSLGKKSSKA